MTARNPKVYVANHHSNRISHRALTTYERRSPQVFDLSHSMHDTWAGAHAALVEARKKQLDRARKELKSAERALAKAQAMTPEERS